MDEKIELIWDRLCETIYNQKIPATLRNDDNDSFGLYFNGRQLMENNKMTDLTLACPSASYKQMESRLYDFFYPFFNTEDQKILDNGLVVCVLLHEIGHAHTMNRDLLLNDRDSKRLISHIQNPVEAQRCYRELPSESAADRWALDWAKEHIDYIRELSNLIVK